MSDVQSKQVTQKKPATPAKKAAPVTSDASIKGDLPESVKLAAPHGFLTDDGDLVAWLQNEVVTDPDDIALLIQRGARLYGIADEPAEPAKVA